MSAAHVLSPHWMRHLPAGTTSRSIATEAREAGLAFLEGSASHWGKRELALWLSGPYASLTSLAGPRPPRRRVPSDAFVREGDVAHILRDARWHVLAELETAALPDGNVAFADRLLAHGLVLPAMGDDGVAWIPVDVGGRLRTRVLSLFAADALARSLDYSRALHVCHRCESVLFDPFARRRGNCGRHAVDVPRVSFHEAID